MYRCRGSSHTATVLGYSYNCQTAVCTDTCPNQLMKFCPCNGVMHRLASRFCTRKTCSKRHSLPPNKHGGFVATQCHVRCDVMPSSRIPALEVILIFIMIYLRVFFIFFIENCPKLRVCIPNFGQTLICYFRSKLRVRSVSSDNNICFKKYYEHSWANINNFGNLIRIFEAVKLKIVRKTSKWLRFLKVLANHSYKGWRHLVIN